MLCKASGTNQQTIYLFEASEWNILFILYTQPLLSPFVYLAERDDYRFHSPRSVARQRTLDRRLLQSSAQATHDAVQVRMGVGQLR